MAKFNLAEGEVDIYRVGALYDLWHLYRMVRFGQFREAARKVRYLWRCRSTKFYRDSYWNGYLAEMEGPPRCGHGWTKRRALASLRRAIATTHWAQHSCGTVRLACDETTYCLTCGTDDHGWTRVAAPVGRTPDGGTE